MCKVNPTSQWQDKLEDLIDDHAIDLDYMGFPSDWKDKFLEIENIN